MFAHRSVGQTDNLLSGKHVLFVKFYIESEIKYKRSNAHVSSCRLYDFYINTFIAKLKFGISRGGQIYFSFYLVVC